MKASLEAPACDGTPFIALDSFLDVSHRMIHLIIGNFERMPVHSNGTIDIGFGQGLTVPNGLLPS